MDYVTKTFSIWLVCVLCLSLFAFLRKEARHDCFKAAAGGTTLLMAVAFSVMVEKLLIIILN